MMLFHAVQAYKAVYPKAPGLNILKPGLIYPIDWRRTVWGPNDGPGAEPFTVQNNHLCEHLACACMSCLGMLLTCLQPSSHHALSAMLRLLGRGLAHWTRPCAWHAVVAGRSALAGDADVCGSLQVMSSASATRRTPTLMRRAARRASLRPMPSPTGPTPGDGSLPTRTGGQRQ